MPNAYVDFVSDEDFLKCTSYVVGAFAVARNKASTKKWFQELGTDPFKIVFDMKGYGLDFSQWKTRETFRRIDKTINNKIGEFHQKLLGKVDGWEDLGTGDSSHVDLKKSDDTIFIELKNKYNTVNSSSLKQVRNNLEECISNNADAISYWAFIVAKDGSSGEEVWDFNHATIKSDNIKKIWGNKVYNLITGDPHALEKTWTALPKAISDVIEHDKDIAVDMAELKQWFADAF